VNALPGSVPGFFVSVPLNFSHAIAGGSGGSFRLGSCLLAHQGALPPDNPLCLQRSAINRHKRIGPAGEKNSLRSDTFSPDHRANALMPGASQSAVRCQPEVYRAEWCHSDPKRDWNDMIDVPAGKPNNFSYRMSGVKTMLEG